MAQMVGKYIHEKSENLDEYFKAIGVPYIPRKMMIASNPTVEVTTSEDGQWSITITTLFRTVSYKFNLGEEYEEHMPGATIKSITTIEGDKLITQCISPDNTHTTRVYSFSEDGLIISYKHEESGKEAIRHFKRV
ncbi:fatty acid-binding protein-like isoform X2 [Cylas formicarius]|nr:fatty acid-binding protein-like isoform X2 [Cylas formicarius]XP_060528789.1 fatty acid-binding protein-like isoform X2 [Cylas formicarius]XP_060528791.1 fatty acid-binding protein-like isoform X2 [Cylas formicarius]XP_060528792.1 fatty acid-binding protein-like isoform X2 [Cylas formicarius]XP_060528793.1 fatty acid-binding protein-like isoform X2 [Cylas formicarius]XP_060528794.1 fatty acid-binding protein-like isoform X2 [Cylas formicarius]